jgi:peptidoglycan/LPS O-acetylase OafA/YrhL
LLGLFSGKVLKFAVFFRFPRLSSNPNIQFTMSFNENTLSSVNSVLLSDETEAQAVRFKHIPALDGLRGIAVLVVMIYHLIALAPALQAFVLGGFLGVDIFFVLSGFLITSILIKEYEERGQINLKKFYLRRLFRLVPAFWTFLICLYFFGNYILPVELAKTIYSDNNLFFAFSYLMNWHGAFGGLTGILTHTWSLAIEEQFYIIWSLVLFAFFARKMTRGQIFIWTAISISVLIVWRYFRLSTGVSTLVLYYSTDTRIDALLIGCAAAMIYSWQLLPKKFYASRQFNLLALISLVIAFFMLLGVSKSDSFLYGGVLSIFAIAVAIIILWILNRKNSLPEKLLEIKPLRWFGQISYGLYLWHYPFYEFGKKMFDSLALQIIVGVGLAIIVSTVSFYFIEKPFLKLKNKFSS